MDPNRDRASHRISYRRLARTILLVYGASGMPLASAEDAPKSLRLAGQSQIHFALASEGAEILGRADEFVQCMGPLERQLRLQAERPVSIEEYLRFAREQVLEWTHQEADHLREVVEPLRARCERFASLWPDRILLIKSTGREEGQAPHCRGNAIVLPVRMLRRDPERLQKVLVHELFHILSRQSVERRAELYTIVGFRAVAPIALPEIWHKRRVTNPDASQIDCVIRLNHEGQAIDVAPIMVTRKEVYDPPLSEASLFRELQFGLMPVELQDGTWVPTETARQGKLWRPEDLPDYSAKIGRNTSYIIHPEEILADNFVHLVLQTPNVPDPQIVDQLAKKLQGARLEE